MLHVLFVHAERIFIELTMLPRVKFKLIALASKIFSFLASLSTVMNMLIDWSYTEYSRVLRASKRGA